MDRKNFGAVCTNDYARDLFKSWDLTYDNVDEGDILVLIMMLNKELKSSNKTGETSCNITLSRRVDMKKETNGTIKSCFLYVNSHYFTRRECISFNSDGFIGFAGWADQQNVNPILRAFLKWCEYLADIGKEDS